MKITREQLAADNPDLLESLLAEGRADGAAKAQETAKADLAEAVKAATAAETARIKGVFDASFPGHEALVQQLAFDGKTTPEQAALQFNQAEKAKGKGHLADIAAERGRMPGHGGAPDAEHDEGGPVSGEAFSAQITAHINAEAAKGRQLTAAQAARELRTKGKE